MFSLLQKIGKALMTPIAVLPIAAILLRLGFGDIPYINGDIANIMKVAGETVFSNLDMLFAVGIAYGLAKNNDGAAALSALVGILIAKAVYLEIDKDLNMGVFIGIIIGILAGVLYNRFHTIKPPEFLGFFGGKRFVPIITALSSIVVGVLAGYFWHYAQSGIDTFSNTIISLDEIGSFLYGTLNRLLIPLGLHHILNSVFLFQVGEYEYIKDGATLVANGDLHRFFAGDPKAGIYMAGFYVTMMFGLPAMALAIYATTAKAQRKKAGAILAGVAFTSFLTGITEPLEFLFLFIAPLLFLLHALLTGLAVASAHFLDIHHGYGFSAGFIDYIINYKLATNPLLILPLGLAFGFIYFMLSYYLIKIFKYKIFSDDNNDEKTKTSNEALAFIEAFGGKENIVFTDACITRLRMEVKNSNAVNDETLLKLGAKGVIKPTQTTLQVVLGTRAETVAELIKKALQP
ncbi:MAG: PTS system, N-acetylglucosamine-specific IIA component (EC / PTS system, N-acetylglucosamine-specific IIB component (EC / PTS system, N-acetylglucosamine-specific IIC component (EC [uncultured Sulfurovum sp.]|uniref:PTS system, N-acetylglucosamine-specific IIA component )) n=1 Tax=uncultured Sulfurovum sp. TaxID=269237 RepID=A0A6S6SGU7_9BACT|nr:MAG: PTS system, N-acetylglucosamine-specific IIA component (EC / PTS system, N-acetylglucosamine-specific IIB component (EC / PTS system, N-acetylglucosamine-specific IIC component (EC [uncultured Sulfurovum sp.]